MDKQEASQDLQFIREIVHRSHHQIDPRAIFLIIWGGLLIPWYPLANYFILHGNHDAMITTHIAACILGSILCTVCSFVRYGKKRKLKGENTFIAQQVKLIVAFCCGTAAILTVVVLTQFHDTMRPGTIESIWGLMYAVMAFMIGVVYSKEFLISGLWIFTGVVLAFIFADYSGYILGPFMGLGMLVPGIIAEKRVKQLMEQTGNEQPE